MLDYQFSLNLRNLPIYWCFEAFYAWIIISNTTMKEYKCHSVVFIKELVPKAWIKNYNGVFSKFSEIP